MGGCGIRGRHKGLHAARYFRYGLVGADAPREVEFTKGAQDFPDRGNRRQTLMLTAFVNGNVDRQANKLLKHSDYLSKLQPQWSGWRGRRGYPADLAVMDLLGRR